MSTAILSVTYRISSELRSQATAGLVSTTVGDHVGIRGAVGSLFAFVALCFAARNLFRCSRFPLGPTTLRAPPRLTTVRVRRRGG